MPAFGLVLDLSHSGFAAVLTSDPTADSTSEAWRVAASEVRQGGTRHDDLADWLETLLTQAGAVVEDSTSTHRSASISASLWKQVEWMCVGLGPGSFTGIRIAMAFAQGVALPHRIPLFGFTSFEALFLSYPAPERVEGSAVAAIAANAGRFYVSTRLDDPGVLIDKERFESAAAGKKVLTPAEATWDYARIARHALSAQRDARKPYYLQLSAAEDKALADNPGSQAGGL